MIEPRGIEIVPAEIGHIVQISERLRQRERRAYDQLPDAPRILTRALAASFIANAALVDGEVAVVWGLSASLLSNSAELWMIGTDLIEQHRIAFLRRSLAAIDEFAPYFRNLHGWVAADFAKSIRWLEWLGFEVGREAENGILSFRGTLPLRKTQRRGFGVR